MLGIMGFILLVGIMAILFWGKISPTVAFIVFPIIFALILGYNPIEIGSFIQRGVNTTTSTAVLFIFSIPFFTIMNDVGVFDPFINTLIKAAQGNIMRVTIFTVLLTIVAHLDGAGASTALIAVPALLPVYKKMNIRPHVLVCLIALAAGVMNITPWGGPTIRAATILGIDANVLWRSLMPVQVIGLGISLALAVWFAMTEKKHAETARIWYENNSPTKEAKATESKTLPMWQMLANYAILLVALGTLVWGEIQSFAIFMTGTALVLALNFRTLKEQSAAIERSSKGVLAVVTVLLASGALLGVLEHTEMLGEMGLLLINIIPEGIGNIYNLLVGFLAGPIAVVFGTDAYFFGLLPVISEVGQNLGVAPEASANILLIGHNSTVFVSPMTPAMFLLIGLAGVDVKEHLKFSLPYAIVISWVYVIISYIFGII